MRKISGRDLRNLAAQQHKLLAWWAHTESASPSRTHTGVRRAEARDWLFGKVLNISTAFMTQNFGLLLDGTGAGFPLNFLNVLRPIYAPQYLSPVGTLKYSKRLKKRHFTLFGLNNTSVPLWASWTWPAHAQQTCHCSSVWADFTHLLGKERAERRARVCMCVLDADALHF